MTYVHRTTERQMQQKKKFRITADNKKDECTLTNASNMLFVQA